MCFSITTLNMSHNLYCHQLTSRLIYSLCRRGLFEGGCAWLTIGRQYQPMRGCIRPSLRGRFTGGANQRRERAGRASDAACCRGNGVVTVYGIVPVDWKLPPFRQGINLLIDTVYFIVTLWTPLCDNKKLRQYGHAANTTDWRRTGLVCKDLDCTARQISRWTELWFRCGLHPFIFIQRS